MQEWAYSIKESFINMFSKKSKEYIYKDIENNDIKKLTKVLEYISDLNVIKRQQTKLGFVFYNTFRGILQGIGTVIGAIVVIALIISVLPYFKDVPVIGPFIELIIESANKYESAKQGPNFAPSPHPTALTLFISK